MLLIMCCSCCFRLWGGACMLPQMWKWGGCDIHVFDPTVDFERTAPKLKKQVRRLRNAVTCSMAQGAHSCESAWRGRLLFIAWGCCFFALGLIR